MCSTYSSTLSPKAELLEFHLHDGTDQNEVQIQAEVQVKIILQKE